MANETTEQLELLVMKLEAHIEQLKVDAAMARQQLVNAKARLRQRKRRAGEEVHTPKVDPFAGLPDAYRETPAITADLQPKQKRMAQKAIDKAIAGARNFYLEDERQRAEQALEYAHQLARGELIYSDSWEAFRPNPNYVPAGQAPSATEPFVPLDERSPEDILAELMEGHTTEP